MTTWILAALMGLMAGPAPARADVRVEAVWLALGRAGDIPSDAVLHARKGEDVRLHVVVEARVGKRLERFASVPRVKRRGRVLRGLKPWPKAYGPVRIDVYKLEPNPPANTIYDNTGTLEHNWHPDLRASHPKRWHWCTPEYVQTHTRWGSVWSHRADARPTTTRNYGGLGTMRYTARVKHGRRTVWSPGAERSSKAGLKPGIAMLQVRRDDTVVGWMTELLNVPYVYGSHTPNGRDRDHQAEHAQGADCADMVVYGWRRMKRARLPKYTWTGGLVGQSKRRVKAMSLRGGRYRDAQGRAIAFGKSGIQPGDMLLWKGHVAVIAATDKSGYLTPNTLILHTVIQSTALVPLKQIGFGFDAPPFDIRRAKWAR